MITAPYELEPLDLAAPMRSKPFKVLPEWLDYNGHMNMGYYLIAFDHGTVPLFRNLGLDDEYTARKIGMYFALECHINYVSELLEGADFETSIQILDHDSKRIHTITTMHPVGSNSVVSTCEIMWVNVDYHSRKTADLPPWAMERLELMAAEHKKLPRPDTAGRQIGIRRKPA